MKTIIALRAFTTLLLVGVASMAWAQASDQTYLHNRMVMERAVVAGAGGQGIPLGSMSVSPPGTVGDVYLVKDFRITTFWLYEENKMVTGYASKLDLQRNEFDVHMGKSGIRSLAGSKVKSMMWADSLTKTPQFFVNAQEYKNEEDVPYLGFFQIMSEGDLTLLKLTHVRFKPADHNPTHNTVTKDNRFLKFVDLYVAKGSNAAEIPNRKGILKLMESHRAEVEKFIQVNEINFNSDRHLVALFDYYNSLFKK